MAAVQNHRVEILELLLAKGADVNAKDDEGRTALMLQFNDSATLQDLLNAGADVDARDKDGWTPLMYAVDRLYEKSTGSS